MSPEIERVIPFFEDQLYFSDFMKVENEIKIDSIINFQYFLERSVNFGKNWKVKN